MSFRRRLIALCGAVVAVVAAAALLSAYLATRDRLLDDVDASLRAQAAQLLREPPPGALGRERRTRPLPARPAPRPQRPSDPPALFALLLGDVRARVPPGLPPAVTRALGPAVAAGREDFVEAPLEGRRVRFLVAPAGADGAAVVAQPLDAVTDSLRSLALTFLGIGALGVLAVAGAVSLAARRALRPVADLTATAERIAAARAPSERIDAAGDAELLRLATAFNAMLDALDGSLRAQRRLVADASHELRTPVTALRANVELLLDPRLPAPDRDRISAVLRTQLEDLSTLVADVVEVAEADDRPQPAREPVPLDALVVDVVERARGLHPGVSFSVEAEPTEVDGDPRRLARALANLLDNAAHVSPAGGRVRVVLGEGALRVCDEGPGVPPGERERIFERFHRAPEARPGTGHGLGLAIVAQAARAHDATLLVEDAPGGGACIGMAFPRARRAPALTPSAGRPSGSAAPPAARDTAPPARR